MKWHTKLILSVLLVIALLLDFATLVPLWRSIFTAPNEVAARIELFGCVVLLVLAGLIGLALKRVAEDMR